MTTKPRNKISKLGHDPLAWMAEPPDGSESSTAADDSTMEDNSVASEDPPVTVSNRSEQGVITLPERFGIAQLSDIHKDMRLLLAEDVAIIGVHGDRVESVDAAAMQLLVSFVAEARSNNKKVDFSRRSDKIDEVADLLDLRQALSLE